jgi:thiol-disulfide isomerase/thioredoxin
VAVTRREWLLIAAVGAGAAAAGFGYNHWRTTATRAEGADALLSSRFVDLEGRSRSVDEWRGKVLVVNFWATWCAPCREEIPLFVKLQDNYGKRGLQFIGIAIDQPHKVRPFAAEFGMNFPVLIGSADALQLTRALGNRAAVLPFTVVLTRDARIAATEVGAAKQAQFEPLLGSLL